jgi:hypothetical protein
VAALLVAGALAGCASGTVTGTVTRAGQPSAPLTMKWESGIFGESGKISAVMPDGERFTGKYQVVSKGMPWSYVDPAWTGAEQEAVRGEIDSSMWGAAAENPDAFVNAHLNKAIATLKGDRGSTMMCRFNLDAGESGMGGGGTGECQTSKGAKIAAKF